MPERPNVKLVDPNAPNEAMARPLPANQWDPWVVEADDPEARTISPIRIGRHVVVRPVTPADFEWLYQVAVMTSAGNHWRLHGKIPPMEDFRRLLFDGATNTSIVCVRETSQPVGMVQLFAMASFDRHAQITAFFHPEMQGKGWPLEGIVLYLDYVFTVFGLRKVYLESTTEEIAQFGSALTSILVEEGCLKQHRLFFGRWTDVHYLALYRDKLIEVAGRLLPDAARLTRGPAEDG